MSKHTPGPWRVVTRGNTIKSLAVVGPHHNVCSGISPKTDDARLIAAAPDMLKALNDAEDIISGGIVDIQEALDIIGRAIDMAEGK